MSNRFQSPFEQYWSSTAPYVGGILRFYISGTSTPLAVYSDATLGSSLGTSVTLNAAGRPATAIFLQNTAYKVTLEDSLANLIWTADPVTSSDFAIFPKWTVGSANPNGSVAGTKGSVGVPPDVFWDSVANILYVATTTGSASTAVWTALNASAASPAVPFPQGRLTLTSATPVLVADALAQTTVYYALYNGNLVPIYSGVSTTPTAFTELSLTLVASHAADTIYDIFVFSNSGVLTLVTGPAWTTQTPGSGARGAGAGTTQLSRVNGLWTNTVSMTGRNGSTTYTIGANLATYLGSIYMDHTAGQVSCTVGFGQNRKWGVWNAYNRVPIILKAGDGTASWAYTTNTLRASQNIPATYTAIIANVGGTASNGLTVFAGLAEEIFDLNFIQRQGVVQGSTGTGTESFMNGGIGVNSITAASGTLSRTGISGSGGAAILIAAGTPSAKYILAPALGLQQIFSLEASALVGTSATNLWYGTEANMALTARWSG